MLSTELLKPLVLVTPGRVYGTKMAIRNHSSTFNFLTYLSVLYIYFTIIMYTYIVVTHT